MSFSYFLGNESEEEGNRALHLTFYSHIFLKSVWFLTFLSQNESSRLLTFLRRDWSLRQWKLVPGRLAFNRLCLLHWRTWKQVSRTRIASILFTLIVIFYFLWKSLVYFSAFTFCLLRWAVLSKKKEKFELTFYKNPI